LKTKKSVWSKKILKTKTGTSNGEIEREKERNGERK
jgi:hypothetical protein